MEAAYRKEADCMIVPMPREVDHHVAGNMSREIDLLAESWHVHRIIFDFAGTNFMDSSGIGILIGRKKTMDMHAGKVTAVNRPRQSGMQFVLPAREKASLSFSS